MTSGETLPYKCQHCGQIEHRPGNIPPSDCPNCGKRGWTLTMEFTDEVPSPLEEFDATVTNTDGQIVAERIEKTDGVTNASLSADAGRPSKISIERKQRVGGFTAEGTAAESLAKTYNTQNGTHYIVEDKTDEDSDYADRVLVSHQNEPNRINIQVRNLDVEIIADLGRTGEFTGDRTSNGLMEAIDAAIEDKAFIDPTLKTQTILLLSLPAAIGQKAAQDLQQQVFKIRGFREVWISTFREDCVRLNHA